jgi:WD40 repeat protein
MSKPQQASRTQPLPNKLGHGIYQTIYPVYTCASDDRGVLITAGGGGGGRHGVKNMIQCHVLDDTNSSMLTMSTLDTGEFLPSHVSYSESHRLYTAVLKDQIMVFAIDEAALFQFKVLCLFKGVNDTANIRMSKMLSHHGERSILVGLDTGELRCFRYPPGASAPSASFTLTHSSPVKDSEITDFDFRSDGALIVTCAKNGTTKIWDVSGHEPVCKASLNSPAAGVYARSSRFITDSAVLVAYYTPRGPSYLARFSLEGGKIDTPVVATIPGRAGISAVALGADRKTALVGFSGGNHEIWDVERMKVVKKGKSDEHEMPITAVALFGSSGGLTGSADFTVRLLSNTGVTGGSWLGWFGWFGKLTMAVAVGLAGYTAMSVDTRLFVL